MFLAGDTLDVVTESIYIIFNCSIDFGLYWLINITFDVFFVLARLDIFGATPLGMELYDSLSQRIYMIISIVMVFIFAYNLLLYVMRPDGEYVSKNLKPTLLLKRITFSMVLIIMTPLIFRYMSTFQNHVLASDAIPSLILGREQGTTRVMSKGEKISMMTWMTFIHPRNKTYGDYINDFDADTCGQYFVDPNNANFTVSEQAFVQALIDNCSDGGGFKTTKIVKNAKSWKSDDIEKLPIISSIAAVMLLVFKKKKIICYILFNTRPIKIWF